MNLEDNSLKEPLDYAANLTLAATANALAERQYVFDQKKARYETMKASGLYNLDECQECGAEMPPERQALFEVLCTECKSAQEQAEKRRRG